MGDRSGRMTPFVIVKRNQEALALEMRKAGHSYEQIANRLSLHDRSAAYKIVGRALARITTEPAEELRKLELARLDQMYRAAMEEASKDHPLLYQGELTGFVDIGPRLAAMALALRIMERRAKLLGLDAPARARIEVLSEDVVDAEIKRLEAEIDQRAERVNVDAN